MIGRNLSHYEVLEEVGRGGMGVVYKARDTNLDRLVALKLLPPELADDPRRIALLRREAQASARLNHPRIVTIYAVEEAEDQLFLTMEFVEGQRLDKVILPGGFDLDRFFRIAIPLADAVAAAHDEKIVHRDLKPGNIILSQEDRPKILDFGLARLRPEDSVEVVPGGAPPADSQAVTQVETLDGKLAGTVPYMSPEQLSRQPVDHRTDIFSLGVIFYEMVTGRHPYRSEGTPISSSILASEPDSVADVRQELPRQLGRIIRHCLEKRPEERIQSAKDLRDALGDLQRELSTRDRRPAATSSARPRRRALPALLAAGLLAIAGWLGYDRLSDGQPAATPYHLAIEQARIFPGDRGPEYFRQGVLASFRRQLGGLGGIFVLGDGGPEPDLVLLTDARRSSDTVTLGFRLLDSEGREELGDGVFEGSAADPFELVRRAGRSLARTLDDRPELKVDYRPADPPTDDPEAFDLYLRAAAKGPERGGSGNAAEMQDLLDRALARDPDFALAHLLRGQSHLAQYRAAPAAESASAAEASCRRAAEADPRLAAAHSCLGEALMLGDRTMAAVEEFTRALEIDTSDLRPRFGLREAYRDLGTPEVAEQNWKRLIAVHPGFWGGYFSLGRHYQDAEEYEAALAQYQRAVELAPRQADVHRYLGTIYLYLGRFEEAEVSLRRSIAIRPTWDAYYNLGGLYFNLRRFPASVAAYEQAVLLDESDYRSRGRLGWACFWAQGRRREAAGHLGRAIELADPLDPDARILSALFHAMRGERQESLAALDAALDLRPDDSHYFYLAGLAMNHLGDTEAALEWLGRAVRGGFSTAEIRTIIDLESLSGDARFQQLLREADSAISDAR